MASSDGRNASSAVSASAGPNTSILILSGLRAILSTFRSWGDRTDEGQDKGI
ncbi:hypothetical protein HLH26_19825 [Gluconacetobacter sp. 1b LMG 1731]|uniref:Uncharacterized protein n=1 Tax=Gluconacetobacter dulcium TaxID=2729096 RepID=A0A7W4IPM9_9PROT|nr:hypothetical protein [Gluconacetobacter dulcium]MBB2166726.1 hypothetical protein [Gluconacetobacter dulcium]MBB2195826.1 hypothetical protein [Gluconacetobacter dulcium]